MAAQEIPDAGYRSKLLSRIEVAEGTMAFHFEKPAQFDFKPGQSADVTLSNPPEIDSEGNTRTFSIASSPFENQLVFATRMRDTAFKRSLKKAPLGTDVKIDSPMGSFTLHRNSAKPAVFLAGGIGITPFISIVRQADHDRLLHKLYLFYSNWRPEDACFFEALQRNGFGKVRLSCGPRRSAFLRGSDYRATTGSGARSSWARCVRERSMVCHSSTPHHASAVTSMNPVTPTNGKATLGMKSVRICSTTRPAHPKLRRMKGPHSELMRLESTPARMGTTRDATPRIIMLTNPTV